MSVLLIEDDKSISNFLTLALKSEGYEVLGANNGLTGISLFMSNNPDLIILDLGLPDIDGTEVISHVRESERSSTPIMVVSARGLEREKISALDSGADDYITKPFAIGELMARIRAVMRRRDIKEKTEEFVLDSLRIDYSRRKVYVDDSEVHFTPIEYKILLLLTENRGKVITHKTIQNEIWGYESNDEYQSLRVFMANIRKKIERETPRFIKTEVGVGYRFADE